MKYFQITLTVKMPVKKLTDAEKLEIRSGYNDFREELKREAPEGAITELKIEEAEE